MNKGRIAGGVICLALAGLLGVANLALPPEKLMFRVGDQNMPWIGPLILGILGFVLLVTAVGGRRETAQQPDRREAVLDPERAELNKRLELIGWGCFLIMLGGFILVPHTVVARGFWSIGVGVIMLGLNAVRYLYKLRMSGFTTFLGIVALVGGILQLLGLEVIEGAFLFIILGVFLLFKPWFDRRQLFGKAEEV